MPRFKFNWIKLKDKRAWDYAYQLNNLEEKYSISKTTCMINLIYPSTLFQVSNFRTITYTHKSWKQFSS